MNDYVKVQDEPDLVRDPESGAIININRSSIQKAKDAKKVAIEAFLAARNIKETYALNIESDDEEDELFVFSPCAERMMKKKKFYYLYC